MRQTEPHRTNPAWPDRLAILMLLVTVAVFFFRMFFPRLSILATPDFGLSDAWHFSFATKFALGEALRRGTMPVWQPLIGDGFPQLAEGQTGVFYLPNLVLFRFLSPALAYAVALIGTIGLLGVGTYVFLRSVGSTVIGSFFAASAFMLSGLPILQLPHITLLQGMSLMPWIMTSAHKLSGKRPAFWMAVLSILVTQQIFTGFPQAAFLTAVLAGCFVAVGAHAKRRYAALVLFAGAYILAAAGAAAQLLPSWEFLRATTHPNGFDFTMASQFSMPLKHLVTFLNPYSLGNPKEGTYPAFYQFGGSIFWENTAYIGLLPLVYAGIAFVRARRNARTAFWLAVVFGSIILAWGKNSPLYFIYSFWPFTFFRVPSRFLWLTAFALASLSAAGIDFLVRVPSNRFVRSLVMVSLPLAVIQLMSAWWSYHLFIPAADLLRDPPTVTAVRGKTIYPIGSEKIHNDMLFSKGWPSPEPYRTLYTAGLGADGNIVYGVRQHDVYAGRSLYRSTLADTLLATTIQRDDKSATVSSRLILNLLGIQRIVSFIPVDNLPEVATYQTAAGAVRIYANDEALPRAYLVRKATTAGTLVEANRRILRPDYVPGKTALLETHDVEDSPRLRAFTAGMTSVAEPVSATVTESRSDTITIRANAGSNPALLILTDTYYPGWNAYVDGKEERIYPANIKQRAVVLPPGSHTVRFTYRPWTLGIGLVISAVTELTVLLLAAAAFSGRALYTVRNIPRLFAHFRHSRAT